MPAPLHQAASPKANDDRAVALLLERLAGMEDIFSDRTRQRQSELPHDIVLRLLEDRERPGGELLQGEVGRAHERAVEHAGPLDLAEREQAGLARVVFRRHADQVTLLAEREARRDGAGAVTSGRCSD